MKIRVSIPWTVGALVTFARFGFAEGGPLPSEPPGLAMRFAAERTSTEVRFPISTIPTNLTSPGSYYLTTNLVGVAETNGITVRSDDVTIDLNGFALVGVSNSLDGIHASWFQNLSVRNGTLRGWGQHGGYSNEGGINHWEGITFAENLGGLVSNDGSALVSRCKATKNVLDGLFVEGGNISHCMSFYNGGSGFVLLASNARDCTALLNRGAGFVLLYGTHLLESLANRNEQDGIVAIARQNVISANACSENNWSGNTGCAGIRLASSGNRVADNQVTYSAGWAILVDAGKTNNTIVKNSTVGDKAMSKSIPAGNDSGPWGDAATATSPWANLAN